MLKARCWFGLACSAYDVVVLRADQSKRCRAVIGSVFRAVGAWSFVSCQHFEQQYHCLQNNALLEDVVQDRLYPSPSAGSSVARVCMGGKPVAVKAWMS